MGCQSVEIVAKKPVDKMNTESDCSVNYSVNRPEDVSSHRAKHNKTHALPQPI